MQTSYMQTFSSSSLEYPIETRELLGDLYEELEQTQFSTVTIVDTDPRPFILYDTDLGKFAVDSVGKRYGLHSNILEELMGLLQGIGYLRGGDIKSLTVTSPEDINSFVNEVQVDYLLDKETFIAEIDSFLERLSKLKIVEDYSDKCSNGEKLTYGLFRINSLYDNFLRFKKLGDFLDFLYINLEFHDKFFGENCLSMYEQTAGQIVEGITSFDKLYLPKDDFLSKLGEVSIDLGSGTQDIEVLFRIVPFRAGIRFAVSLNLPDIQKPDDYLSDNYFFTIAVQLENIDGEIIPVIREIQNSFENITCVEGMIYQGESSLDVKKNEWRHILKNAIQENITSGVDSINEIMALVVDKLYASGYKKVACIRGEDNLWISRHSGRDSQNSIKSMYENRILALGGKFDEKTGLYFFSFKEIVSFLGDYPNKLKIYENLNEKFKGLTGRLFSLPNLDKGSKLDSIVYSVESEISSMRGLLLNILNRPMMHEKFFENYNELLVDENKLSTIDVEKSPLGTMQFLEGTKAINEIKKFEFQRQVLEERVRILQVLILNNIERCFLKHSELGKVIEDTKRLCSIKI